MLNNKKTLILSSFNKKIFFFFYISVKHKASFLKSIVVLTKYSNIIVNKNNIFIF